jgi:hypothetical protein
MPLGAIATGYVSPTPPALLVQRGKRALHLVL